MHTCIMHGACLWLTGCGEQVDTRTKLPLRQRLDDDRASDRVWRPVSSVLRPHLSTNPSHRVSLVLVLDGQTPRWIRVSVAHPARHSPISSTHRAPEKTGLSTSTRSLGGGGLALTALIIAHCAKVKQGGSWYLVCQGVAGSELGNLLVERAET